MLIAETQKKVRKKMASHQNTAKKAGRAEDKEENPEVIKRLNAAREQRSDEDSVAALRK